MSNLCSRCGGRGCQECGGTGVDRFAAEHERLAQKTLHRLTEKTEYNRSMGAVPSRRSPFGSIVLIALVLMLLFLLLR